MSPLPSADHRPWPLPRRPWMMAQTWHDLLFAHWPIPPETLRRTLPAGLELDTFGGQGWLGIVPFHMSHIRGRWLPPFGGLSAFPELNVRTYVTCEGKPGVWFYSLDAASWLAVRVARRFFHLPYMDAQMACRSAGHGELEYRSHRTHRREPPAILRATYRPTGEGYHAAPGSLEHWLTERYCLYAADREGWLYRGEIHHEPWTLHPAEAHFYENGMAAAHGFKLPPDPPLLHFVRHLDVMIWLLERVKVG